MKTKQQLVTLLTGVSILLMTLPAVAATETTSAVTASEAASQDAANSKKKKKSTEVSFEDVLVQGKYHFSDEAVTTVEQDKVLDALLGVRTDFKDRLKKSAARR